MIKRYKKYIGRIFPIAAAALLAACASSCTADDFLGEGDDRMPQHGVSVYANIARHTYTKAYQDTGRVVNGVYYMAYPSSTNGQQYTLANVDFNLQSEQTPGLGIVTTRAGEELKWSEIGGSPVNFYLDNVPPTFDKDSLYGPIVKFSEDNNPFVAGLFNSTTGYNDLLWGDKTVSRDTKSLSFDLHHNMSRVKVQVKVAHLEKSSGDISLEGATVRITNLYPKTVSYDRTTGSLELDSVSDLAPVTIVDPNKPSYNWVEIIQPTPDVDTTTYLSPDIVLPPQALYEDENRPRLEIELSTGEVYSGILPYAMVIANPTDGSMTYPVTLSFLKEHILLIRTVITEEPPELAFMPVYVVDWVDKGEFTEEAHQSGIYTATEFYKLIGYYEIDNQYQLVRYGYISTDKTTGTKTWVFNFWSSVVLEYDEIVDSMEPGSVDRAKGLPYDFTFNYNNYTIYVMKGGDEEGKKSVRPEQLHNIVTGNLQWNNF